jgi:hypothetical protein
MLVIFSSTTLNDGTDLKTSFTCDRIFDHNSLKSPYIVVASLFINTGIEIFGNMKNSKMTAAVN